MARIHQTLSGQSIKYDPDPKLERFLKRVQALVDDPKATENDVVALVYGRENPILDHTIFPERGAVTKEVFDNPVYAVLTDQLARKQLQRDGVSPEKLAEKFTVSVATAAARKCVSEDAIRKAIRERRLPAWVRDGEYFLESDSLEAVKLGSRGPIPGTTEPLVLRVGASEGGAVFMKVKKPDGEIAELDPRKFVGARSATKLDAVVDRWRRVGVLTGGHGKLRFFEIVPSTEQDPDGIEFHGFFVRGKFSIVRKVNNAREARQAWEAFRG